MERVDVAVIGGGTAGLTVAQLAAAAGKRVMLAEPGRLGGECTWTGCVPSKALIETARLRHQISRAGTFGLTVGDATVDFPAVMARLRRVMDTIGSYEDAAYLEARGIAVHQVPARLTGPHHVELAGETIEAEHIVVCTGNKPAIPSIPGLADTPYLTNETLFSLERLPMHLIIAGAGIIGMEMGQAFGRLGSAVTIIDEADTVLAHEDWDIQRLAQEILASEGVNFRLGQTITEVQAGSGEFALTLRTGEQVSGDALLIATGRQAHTDGLGLESAGVQIPERGIQVDEHMRTSVEHIYAAGDVTGLYPFTHVAAYQARVAAANILGKRSKVEYRVVPWAIFTDPPIGHVGLTEGEARAQHRDIHVTTLPYSAIDRAVIEDETAGIIKVIANRRSVVGWMGGGEILGAHLIGAGADNLIHEFVLAMQTRSFTGRIAQALHAYPSMAMGDQMAVGLLFPGGKVTIDLREELRSK
ncbi:MAG: FAD-dependent oxidoreductase [Chloroflexota bacterium]|nr:FAD-dependent oxidoreductase [Chloroflexota bacterium]